MRHDFGKSSYFTSFLVIKVIESSVDFPGVTTVKVLNALDALDRHSFERVDASNSLDTLYTKIFPAAYPNPKESPTNQEETRVQYVRKSPTEYLLSLRIYLLICLQVLSSDIKDWVGSAHQRKHYITYGDIFKKSTQSIFNWLN